MTSGPIEKPNPDASNDDRTHAELTVAEAQAIITGIVLPVQEVEQISLRDSLGRVLAETILSPIDVPAYDNAAMDGYAFCSGNLRANLTTSLQVIGTVSAGNCRAPTVGFNECLRIMTGARMPAGCDTVIAQELVQQDAASHISFDGNSVHPQDNCRRAGEDFKSGAMALAAGTLLQPAHLGVLASLGIGVLHVRRRLRVAFFSTGDELRSIGEALDSGSIYDSNRYTLFGMLTRLGCEPIDMGIVKDRPIALDAAFRSACAQADVVISSGGMANGAADHVLNSMSGLGEVTHCKLRMRPGSRLAFGHLRTDNGNACAFGLPGNPVAVMAVFYFVVRPALQKMMGVVGASAMVPMFKAVAIDGIAKKPGRLEYQRGILSFGENGYPQVRLTGAQGSGLLSSMARANCMVVLATVLRDVAAGESVDVVPFDGLI